MKLFSSPPFLQVMSLIMVGIGLLFCLIFHIGTKEPSCQINKTLSVTTAGIVVRFEKTARDHQVSSYNIIVSRVAVFVSSCNVGEGPLRDETKNGCKGD